MDDRSTLVYSTECGRIKEEKPAKVAPKTDGTVRIQLRRLGGNKVLSVVSGLPLSEVELKDVCSALKRKCGTGGSVKDFAIEIQGDKREILKTNLEGMGYKVKLAGG